MLNLGNTAKPFEPYTGGKPSPSPDYEQEIISKEVSEIKFTGKNLFNVEWIKGLNTYENQSKNVARLPKGKYTLKVHGLTEADLKSGSYFAIRIKVGDTYTNTYWIMHPGTPNTKCLTGLKFDIVNDFEINLYIYNNTEEQLQYAYDTLNGHIQINNGYEESQFEPYKEQVVNLTSPITLRGIPVDNGGNVTIDRQQYVADVITEKDGVIGVVRNAESFSLLIKDMNNNDSYPGWKGLDIVEKILPPQANDTQIPTCLCTIQSRVIYARRDFKTIYFTYDELGKNQTELKEQYPDLSVNFIAINYQPTFEPLPEADQEAIRKLKTFYPNTVIDANCFTKIKYVADTKLYIDKKVLDAIQEVI
jgi:hypothetical protein